jgi:hypothetical protein
MYFLLILTGCKTFWATFLHVTEKLLSDLTKVAYFFDDLLPHTSGLYDYMLNYISIVLNPQVDISIMVVLPNS